MRYEKITAIVAAALSAGTIVCITALYNAPWGWP